MANAGSQGPGGALWAGGQLLSSSGQRFPFSLTLGRSHSLGVRGKACCCPRVLSWTHCQVWKAMLAQGLKKGEHAQACTQTTAAGATAGAGGSSVEQAEWRGRTRDERGRPCPNRLLRHHGPEQGAGGSGSETVGGSWFKLYPLMEH